MRPLCLPSDSVPNHEQHQNKSKDRCYGRPNNQSNHFGHSPLRLYCAAVRSLGSVAFLLCLIPTAGLLVKPATLAQETIASLNLSLIHISEPTRLLSISYAVFCLKKKKKTNNMLTERIYTPNEPDKRA
eukprot:TRINITY_DN1746_c0_g1_i3.p1 TRINITY_DN1746_c0_g1~~TRINITY_DN1746_c0_g1_i3.p1  ORF type:complete len:129 (-),score=12.17 TRINITY_DN1746_c0_g1_i3:30-416(-)